MNKWEYTVVRRTRTWARYDEKAGYMWGNRWSQPIEEILRLGEEGWELVTAVPMSSVLGGYGEQYGGAGAFADFAGFTTEQIWVFKRPKD